MAINWHEVMKCDIVHYCVHFRKARRMMVGDDIVGMPFGHMHDVDPDEILNFDSHQSASAAAASFAIMLDSVGSGAPEMEIVAVDSRNRKSLSVTSVARPKPMI